MAPPQSAQQLIERLPPLSDQFETHPFTHGTVSAERRAYLISSRVGNREEPVCSRIDAELARSIGLTGRELQHGVAGRRFLAR